MNKKENSIPYSILMKLESLDANQKQTTKDVNKLKEGHMLFLTSALANEAEITILSARDTTRAWVPRRGIMGTNVGVYKNEYNTWLSSKLQNQPLSFRFVLFKFSVFSSFFFRYHASSPVGSAVLILAELQRAKRASEAPWVRKNGNPSSRENLVLTSAYVRPSERRPYRLWGRRRGVSRCHQLILGHAVLDYSIYR